jgi:phosphate transport system protein
MRSLLEVELNQLRDQILLMGGEVENAIDRAMQALTERDTNLAEQVLADDDRIDSLELAVEQAYIRVLALMFPEARDLRFVITTVKITPVLERIADHACNIARVALALNNEPRLSHHTDVSEMSRIAREMLRASLDAFAASDAAAARAVIDRDDEIDRLYDRSFHDLINCMSEDQNTASRAARLLMVAKHLERIGDYVTDICEQIVYMKEALVIKHSR